VHSHTIELLDLHQLEKSGRGGEKIPKGNIETFGKKSGWVDIDAIVPAALATKMVETIGKSQSRHVHVFQAAAGGMMLIDAQVSAAAAASICAAGQRAGVPIRRHA
jgi:hypothetical protein